MTENHPAQESDAAVYKPSFMDIEKLVFLVMSCGYSWPASALTGGDMKMLNELKASTRKPVTQLLCEAVHLLYETTNQQQAPVEKQNAVTKQKAHQSMTTAVAESPSVRRTQGTLFDSHSPMPSSCAED